MTLDSPSCRMERQLYYVSKLRQLSKSLTESVPKNTAESRGEKNGFVPDISISFTSNGRGERSNIDTSNFEHAALHHLSKNTTTPTKSDPVNYCNSELANFEETSQATLSISAGKEEYSPPNATRTPLSSQKIDGRNGLKKCVECQKKSKEEELQHRSYIKLLSLVKMHREREKPLSNGNDVAFSIQPTASTEVIRGTFLEEGAGVLSRASNRIFSLRALLGCSESVGVYAADDIADVDDKFYRSLDILPGTSDDTTMNDQSSMEEISSASSESNGMVVCSKPALNPVGETSNTASRYSPNFFLGDPCEI